MVTTLVFLALAHEMRAGATQGWDERVLLATRRADDPSIPIGPPWLNDTARDITSLVGSEKPKIWLFGTSRILA